MSKGEDEMQISSDDDDDPMCDPSPLLTSSDESHTNLSMREFSERMRTVVLRLLQGESDMYHVALGNAATEYKYLIQHAPNLYNTQKENLIRNGAAEGLICKCAIDRMFRENREVDWADASNSLVHVQVLHLRSCNQKLSANAQCRDGAHHQSLRFWRAFELLGDNPLRINDKAQWKTFEDVLSGQDALLNCNSNQGKGCSNECICSCLVCSAISGNSSAIKLLGTCYHQGFGVSQDFSIALRWYSLAAVLGVASAMNSIGFLYQEGLGISNGIKVPKNIKDSLSMQWYNLAAKYGDRTAQYNIACAYYNGWGVEPDKNEAFKWYKLAAKKGDADAQAAVGDHYLIGEGVRQNVRKALFWHIKAAKGGNVMAQTTVGHHFYFGWAQADGQRDLNKSFQWHYIAAEKGLSQAQFYVGHLYMHGEGCVKSIQKAYEMWMRGTRQGNPEAMNAIAKLYEDGIDEEGIRIPRNLVVSDYWKDQALKNGLKDPRLEFKTTEHELVALKLMYMKERDFLFLMGLHPKSRNRSPISCLNNFPSLFDRNLIHLIQSFSGDSQLNFERRHMEMIKDQPDVEMNLDSNEG